MVSFNGIVHVANKKNHSTNNMTATNIIPIPFDTQMLSQKKEAYIVGGTARDLLLGRTPTDYDIAVAQNPEIFAKELSEFHRGTLVRLGPQNQQVYRVVAKKQIFDITRLIDDDIHVDLKHRDFTINAMAIQLSSGKLIDIVDGRKDLCKKTVRMVTQTVFEDDPLRLLRAYRLAAAFDFSIDRETEAAVQRNCFLIRHSAGERIRSELLKILYQPSSSIYVRQMAENGLLTTIFPELVPLQNCGQNRCHEFDVYEHTLSAFSQLEARFDGQIIAGHIGIVFYMTEQYPADIPLLKLAMLLHDIGKPPCRTTSENGVIQFFGHEKKGSELFENIAHRLRLSSKETELVRHIIRHHLRPLQLFTAHQKGRLSAKAVTRFFMACTPKIPHLILHALADFEGKGTGRQDELKAFEDFAKELMERYCHNFLPRLKEPRLISGHDLMETFGLTPSPFFSKILNGVETARLSDESMDRAAALKLVAEMLDQEAQRSR